jgi:hypothetical protein
LIIYRTTIQYIQLWMTVMAKSIRKDQHHECLTEGTKTGD